MILDLDLLAFLAVAAIPARYAAAWAVSWLEVRDG